MNTCYVIWSLIIGETYKIIFRLMERTLKYDVEGQKINKSIETREPDVWMVVDVFHNNIDMVC